MITRYLVGRLCCEPPSNFVDKISHLRCLSTIEDDTSNTVMKIPSRGWEFVVVGLW